MNLFVGILMNVAIWTVALGVAYGIYRLAIHFRGERPVEHSFTSLDKGSTATPEAQRATPNTQAHPVVGGVVVNAGA